MRFEAYCNDIIFNVCQKIPAFAGAVALLEQRRYEEARLAFLNLVDEPELTALTLNQLGVIASIKGDASKAIYLFQKATQLELLPLAYWNLAQMLDRQGMREDSTAVMVNLGCLLDTQLGQHALAIEVYQRVLARDPINYAAYVNLGTIYARTNHIRDAIQHLFCGLRLYSRVYGHTAHYVETLQHRLSNTPLFPLTEQVLPAGSPGGL